MTRQTNDWRKLWPERGGERTAIPNAGPDFPHIVSGLKEYDVDAPPDGRLGHLGFGINLVLQGTGVYTDYRNATHNLEPGCLYVRVGKYEHSTLWERREPVVELISSVFRLSFEHLERLGLAGPLPPVVKTEISKALPLYRRLYELSPTVTGAGQEGAEAFDAYIDLCREMRRGQWTTGLEVSSVTPAVRKRITLACRYLTADPLLTPEALARQLGISHSLLRRQFRNIQGLSMKEFAIRARLGRARQLLESHTVTEVAEALGYADAFSFSKQFKQREGISPKQFQMRYYCRHS